MKSIVVANWKMHPATFREAKTLFEATKRIAESASRVSIVVAPPAIFLRELSRGYKGRRIAFAVQNAHFEKEGAYTGETSLAEAKDAKAAYVIVGHGERRAMGETNDDTRRKMAAALVQRLTPILCVGERERASEGKHFDIVREQLKIGLADVPAAKLRSLYIMYEPLWAVGSGHPVTPSHMLEMSIFIKKSLVAIYGEGGHGVRILYGGSVDHTNARQMIDEADVAGFIVGGASLDAEKFKALIGAIEGGEV